MKKPPKSAGYPDRDLDCQLSMESDFQKFIETSVDAGWNRQEVLEAAVELALAHLMADDENAKTDFAIAMARRQLHYERPATPELPEAERLAHAETFIANLGVKTEFGGSEAYYRPSADTVFMPPFTSFRDAASYYGVWLHECGHASGTKHRLDRDLSGRFGSAAYAAEECCVEILSGLILADLSIVHHPRPDHAAYVASWLKVLKNDPKADWMHSQQPQSDTLVA